MKNEKLTTDEFDALEQIARGIKTERVSACVARNSKRLSGLKLVSYARDGRLSITDKAQQVLFVRRCIQGLRAVAADPLSVLAPDIAYFLGKKAHIVARTPDAGYDITEKGRESLADMDLLGH
jgi:Mn-dependent DtxR family transcriptional regulator